MVWKKYEEITRVMSQPEILADQSKYQKYAKVHSELMVLVDTYRQYKRSAAGAQRCQDYAGRRE